MSSTESRPNLPSIESYSPEEITGYLKYSSAAQIYFDLLKTESLDHIYKERHESWLKVSLANFYSRVDQQSRSLYWSMSMDQIVQTVFDTYFTKNDCIIVLALGKFGSEVLNLSSDIDIILIADEPITNNLLKKTRAFIKHLNAKTPFGFLTRVDLNLKPTGHPSPVVSSEHLVNYLWNSSELWERLVYTRSRKVCGRLADEKSLFSEISKFCFRKYIRLDLVVDLAELLQKIMINNYDEKNIKLCPGGIRSIELLLSTIQLLYAGRVIEFQSPKTYQILESLDKIRIFSKPQIHSLRKNYDLLRSLEDKVQSSLDEQTHSLESIDFLEPTLKENNDNIELFLNTIDKSKSSKSSAILEKLNDLSITYTHLDEFVLFLKKHPSYVKLFELHPKSYQNLLKSLTYSPQVTKLILLRPDLMDMFLVKKTYFESEDSDEDFLIKLSDFKSISQITAIGEFLTSFDLNKFLLRNSKIADFSVQQILKRVFGDKPVDVLKLGKWSANQLGVFSDLDFVFLHEGEENLSKQARKFISYLTHGTFHGPFYNIDLRLRPSGRAGPILTSSEKLRSFLEKSSPAWLRQAYLRNHLLNSNRTFNFKLPITTDREKSELKDIRLKRFVATNHNSLSLKDNFGAIVDLEFFIQCLFLETHVSPESYTFENQTLELIELKAIDKILGLKLINNYKKLRFLEQLSEILYKNTWVDKNKFSIMINIDGVKQSLELDSFASLIELIDENYKIIEENHPFMK